MREPHLLAAAIVVSLLAISCNRTKECRCTSIQKWDDTEIEPITGYSTIKLYDGNCSDKNSTNKYTDLLGPYTITITCAEM